LTKRITGMIAALVVLIVAGVGTYLFWQERTESGLWPDDQALPSFAEPAPVLDLVNLNEKLVYEGEDDAYGHETGQADGDGWKATEGTDEAGLLLSVKDVTDIPAGETKAIFHLSVDRFADENHVVAKLEVKDRKANTVIGSLEVMAWDFNSVNGAQAFEVPLAAPDSGHPLEIRVIWTGKQSLKLHDVEFSSPAREAEVAMIYSLQGLVNKSQPRIYKDNGTYSGKYWLEALKLDFEPVKDNWQLLEKYRSSVKGLIVYDPDVPDTYNLATTIAGLKEAVVASPSLLDRLAGEPYKLPILEDLRGKYKTKLEVYEDLYDHYWKETTHRVIIGLTPDIKTHLREYAIAIRASVIWLNPGVPEEEQLLDRFLGDMPYGTGLYLGWWPDEQAGVEKTSEFGIATVAADWSDNLTVLGGTPRKITPPKAAPVKPPLENKVYVTYILSDGDNLQYMEKAFLNFWSHPERGKIPLGWTVSPLMVDAMPGILDYLNRTATDQDVLVSGPSGLGYTYPNNWTDKEGLATFFQRTKDYMERAGIRVLTVWNTVTGTTAPEVGEIIADNVPSLLGFTSQGNTGVVSVYGNAVPGQELHKGYASSEGDLIDNVRDAIKRWDRKSPLFVGIQANPWQVTYENFVNAVAYFQDNKDVIVVRPDIYFQLIRESKGLPPDPPETN
jgi:hypothetical protein